MIIQGFKLLLLLGVAPLGTGLIVNNLMNEENRSLGISYISGFLTLLAVFQLVAVPIVFFDGQGFPVLVKIFTCVTAVLTGLGVVFSSHRFREGSSLCKGELIRQDRSKTEKIQWIILLILIVFQIIMSLVHTFFDGDDAYYVVQSVITEETDTLYRISPYTGLSTGLDMRHSMAVFPIWIAYIARMTGIHAAVVSHTVLPIVLIPLTYWIYLEIGKKLLKEKKEHLPAYMLMVWVLQIFGNVSIYSSSTFFLMRTWQGKSMLANVVIPSVFMILLWLFEGEPEKRKPRAGLWLLLFIVNMVAAMMSTASVFLNSILLAVMALVLAWREKDVWILPKMALTCIPCAAYGLLYLLI